MDKEEIERIVRQYLIDHMEVKVTTDSEWEDDHEYNTISVEVSLDGEVIHSDSDSVRIN